MLKNVNTTNKLIKKQKENKLLTIYNCIISDV